ncbi:hypothetical protein [Bounagaea algeriensis]
MATTCSTGERSAQRASALERDIAELRREWQVWRAQLGQWESYTPPLYSLGQSGDQRIPVNLGTGGSRNGWYIRVGERLHLRVAFGWGQPPFDAGPGRVISELPPGLSTPSDGGNHYLHAHLWTTSGTEGFMDWAGSALLHPGAPTWLQPMFPFNKVDARLGFYTIAGPTAGDNANSVPYIASGFPEGGTLVIQGTVQLEGDAAPRAGWV